MVEQFWFGTSREKLLGVLRSPGEGENRWGCLFFPGFGQTKAGSYFIFSRLAQRLSAFMPTLQFDYRGWGDSQGESVDCTLESLLTDAGEAVRELQRRTGCEYLMMIGAGFGNWIAARAGNRTPPAALVLLSPYREPLTALWREAVPVPLTDEFVDTARLGDWSTGGPLLTTFQRLGEGLNRSKGIRVSAGLLEGLTSIHPVVWLKDYPGPVLEVQAAGELQLDFLPHRRTVLVPRSDFMLLHPADRELVVDEVTAWAQRLVEEAA